MNWKSLIADLRAAGWTLTAIAAAAGAPLSTVSEIAQGRSKQPRGELAIRLYRMAQQERIWPPEDARDAA